MRANAVGVKSLPVNYINPWVVRQCVNLRAKAPQV